MTTTINKPIIEGLKHGEYKIKMRRLAKNSEIEFFESIVKPLTQEDLANGWLQVSNKSNKKIIHHFSIYLSQLPSNLWTKIKRTYLTVKNSDYYKKIKYNNYHYSIKYTNYDKKILELYKYLMMTKRLDLIKISELYKELNENRVKGWIMIYALRIINT